SDMTQDTTDHDAASQAIQPGSPRERELQERISLALHARFDPVLDEPVPARLSLRRPAWQRYAQTASLLAFGILVGAVAQSWRLSGNGGNGGNGNGAALAARQPFAHRALVAHAVYSPEVRHPVEVDAEQQAHLVAWFSKRLGRQLKTPVLTAQGYALLGGRLLPGDEGPVAQFMYQNTSGQRLTLYISAKPPSEAQSAFRFASERGVSAFYWIDGDWGYALSGNVGRGELSGLAGEVYKQLNPGGG
ncbi:MAG: anti-sigma factor, partial [Candidatus Protistobacter heckmanni]|nr:anti-sigma factor [Candidatus Protistobacter heckmanni]